MRLSIFQVLCPPSFSFIYCSFSISLVTFLFTIFYFLFCRAYFTSAISACQAVMLFLQFERAIIAMSYLLFYCLLKLGNCYCRMACRETTSAKAVINLTLLTPLLSFFSLLLLAKHVKWNCKFIRLKNGRCSKLVKRSKKKKNVRVCMNMSGKNKRKQQYGYSRSILL